MKTYEVLITAGITLRVDATCKDEALEKANELISMDGDICSEVIHALYSEAQAIQAEEV